MPKKRQKLGGYWLEKLPDRETWYVCWYDAGSGYRRRRSLGTADHKEAESLLLQFAVENRTLKNEDPASVPVASIISTYLDKHATGQASFPVALAASQKLVDFFGNLTVAEVKHATQQRYVEKRRKEGVSDSTISRELTIMRAAINRAFRMGELSSAPFIISLPKAPPRERWLTPEEASRLLDASISPHVTLYIMLALHTAARPGAVLDLTWDRIDMENHRIDLNPPGRAQNKKRRPMIPISETLQKVLKEAFKQAIEAEMRRSFRARRPVSPATAEARIMKSWIVSYKNKHIATIKRAFEKCAERAGLPGVTAYTLRHTAATWMAQGGVPLWQISGMLGHSISRTTELYAKHHPDYMKEATAAMDKVFGGFSVNFRSTAKKQDSGKKLTEDRKAKIK